MGCNKPKGEGSGGTARVVRAYLRTGDVFRGTRTHFAPQHHSHTAACRVRHVCRRTSYEQCRRYKLAKHSCAVYALCAPRPLCSLCVMYTKTPGYDQKSTGFNRKTTINMTSTHRHFTGFYRGNSGGKHRPVNRDSLPTRLTIPKTQKHLRQGRESLSRRKLLKREFKFWAVQYGVPIYRYGYSI